MKKKDVQAVRRALEKRISTRTMSKEARCSAVFLCHTLRNLERDDVPILRQFLADDLARLEDSERS